MKVQEVLEFDLEADDRTPMVMAEQLHQAAGDTDHAIRNRLMGGGFLAYDLLVRSWTLRTQILDGTPDDRDLPP